MDVDLRSVVNGFDGHVVYAWESQVGVLSIAYLEWIGIGLRLFL